MVRWLRKALLLPDIHAKKDRDERLRELDAKSDEAHAGFKQSLDRLERAIDDSGDITVVPKTNR